MATEQRQRPEDLVELRGADSAAEATLEDIWIAGVPLGKILKTHDANLKGHGKQYEGPIRDEIEDLRETVKDLERRLDETNADVSGQQREKIDRIEDLVEHAVEHGRGGPGGVTVETPAATAVCGRSKETALSYMNELGAVFEWADTKSPGGPKPKQLRINTANHTLDELLEDVRDHYHGGGS